MLNRICIYKNVVFSSFNIMQKINYFYMFIYTRSHISAYSIIKKKNNKNQLITRMLYYQVSGVTVFMFFTDQTQNGGMFRWTKSKRNRRDNRRESSYAGDRLPVTVQRNNNTKNLYLHNIFTRFYIIYYRYIILQ